ncbi:hypothetical protein FB45DRAFT_182837 [Roridomyces roridus]|uniref:Uncharacterized protein n=1 Tax=Roridomyces roridus TaxID=1738132 RepID=A0AAD7FYQ4_9AGAR|nr:hypothetical protein FB45DRAFT_182837 [Roridomyces roridus]
MPLFKPHHQTTNEPAPPPVETTNDTGSTRRGFFGRSGRRSLDDGADQDGGLNRNGSVMSGTDSVRSGNSGNSGGGRGPGFFGRNGNMDVHNDPTILAARDKVGIAERAEAEADRALMQARAMVKEAKEHVLVLEREAAAEAKRAQQKQAMSNLVSKSAAGLGRHGA